MGTVETGNAAEESGGLKEKRAEERELWGIRYLLWGRPVGPPLVGI